MYAGRVRVCALKGQALSRACDTGEIAMSGSRRMRSTLAAASALFTHAVFTEAKNRKSTTHVAKEIRDATGRRTNERHTGQQ